MRLAVVRQREREEVASDEELIFREEGEVSWWGRATNASAVQPWDGEMEDVRSSVVVVVEPRASGA